MWGRAKVNAAFADLSGDATVAGGTVTRAQIVIGSASIDIKNAQRDKHLRSKAFLHAEKHPNSLFNPNSIAPSGPSGHRPQQPDRRRHHQTEQRRSCFLPQRRPTITLATELHIDGRDYGLTWNKIGMASMNNSITVAAVFIRS